MIEFKIESMTCGHCASQVKQAIGQCDINATVQVDLRNRRVRVESTQSEAVLRQQLDAAGYPAT